MSVVIQHTANGYSINFPYRPRFITLVKAIPGRRFDHATKSWMAPLTAKSEVEKFAEMTQAKWNFGHAVKKETVTEFIQQELPELTVDIPTLKMQLFDYQKKGVAYGLQKKRLIIGDQPGLGKTSQAIAIAEGANHFPILVICPSSLKINWQREIKQWTGKDAMILDNNTKHNFHFYWQAGLHEYFITNYESLKKYFVEKIEIPKGQKMRLNHVTFKKTAVEMFQGVIIDESHRVKSTSTQQTKFTKGICNNKPLILALTGTPVINKPKDLIAQLGIIGRMPEMITYNDFVNRFCNGPKEASNLPALNKLLTDNCFYRRDKSAVLKDLPPKTRQVVISDITTREEYMDAERDLENYLIQYRNATEAQVIRAMRGEIMVRIGVLKNISARGKVEAVSEFIDDTLASGEKLIVFAHLKEVINELKKLYPRAVTITGDDDMRDRQYAVDRFQKDPDCKLIICSIKAAGVGLTLTASSRVCFIELPWTFADCEQCEDRAHRVGQTDNVTCTYFLGNRTIDQKIYQLIIEKKNIAKAVTGSQEEIQEDVISQLIDLFNQPNN